MFNLLFLNSFYLLLKLLLELASLLLLLSLVLPFVSVDILVQSCLLLLHVL